MFKKIVIVSMAIILVLIITFKINKKEEIKESEKITILLETEEGNIKTNSFPSKEEYSFDKINCTNLSNDTNITPSFNEETWKLNLTATSTEKLDGNFGCEIYFKEKIKYTVNINQIGSDLTIEPLSSTVNKNDDAIFTVVNNTSYSRYPVVSCTNGQSGSVIGNTLTVRNVTNDTTCTVTSDTQPLWAGNGGEYIRLVGDFISYDYSETNNMYFAFDNASVLLTDGETQVTFRIFSIYNGLEFDINDFKKNFFTSYKNFRYK